MSPAGCGPQFPSSVKWAAWGFRLSPSSWNNKTRIPPLLLGISEGTGSRHCSSTPPPGENGGRGVLLSSLCSLSGPPRSWEALGPAVIPLCLGAVGRPRVIQCSWTSLATVDTTRRPFLCSTMKCPTGSTSKCISR